MAVLEPSKRGPHACRWAATLGIVLAISRGFIAEQGVAFEPELALLEVVAHTHWLPRHWRGRGHTREVQEQFQQLFQFKVRHPPPHRLLTSTADAPASLPMQTG